MMTLTTARLVIEAVQKIEQVQSKVHKEASRIVLTEGYRDNAALEQLSALHAALQKTRDELFPKFQEAFKIDIEAKR